MSSRQAKEEKAEVAARYAADELKDAREEREFENQGAKLTDLRQEEKPGLIGNVLKSVQGTLEQAKEAVVGKGNETADATREQKVGEYDEFTKKAEEQRDYSGQKAGEAGQKIEEYKGYSSQKAGEGKDSAMSKAMEAKDVTFQKAEEYKDYTADKAKGAKDYVVDKAKETKDCTADKAKEAKDATMQKAGEYKDYAAEKGKEGADYTADKARQGKDYTVEKAVEGKDYTVDKAVEGKEATGSAVTGLKDSATGAARRAMYFFTGKKDEAKEKSYEAAEHSKEVLEGSEDEAMQMEEMTLKDRDFKNEAEREKMRAEAHCQAAAERGTAAHGNICSAIGSVTESIKHKFTQPTDVVDQTRAAREHGGAGRIRVEMDVEQTPEGKVASTLKAADQLSGQAFDDTGGVSDKGALRVEVDPATGERKVTK